MATVLGPEGAPAAAEPVRVDAAPAAAVPVVNTPVVPQLRSQVSTSAGASLAVAFVWLWNQVLAPWTRGTRLPLPEMPIEVAQVVTIYAADQLRQLMSRPGAH